MSHLSATFFHDEAAAIAEVEAILWPNGPVCPRCRGQERITKVNGKTARPGLWRCGPCKRQFTVTVGTVFESSHISLNQWLQVIHLLASSKKGISSHQIMRTLNVQYKTAWFMTHRIREAMETGFFSQIGGSGKIVEVDETFIGKKEGAIVRRGYAHKRAVMTLVERGGAAKSFHVEGTSAKDLLPIIKAHVHPDTHMMSDEAGQYAHLNKHFKGHDVVRHGIGEYGRGEAHTNTLEGIYSVFKRGMKGIYQHCAEHHLHRYVSEFDFRYNNRIRMGIDDIERARRAIRGAVGKRLMFRQQVTKKVS